MNMKKNSIVFGAISSVLRYLYSPKRKRGCRKIIFVEIKAKCISNLMKSLNLWIQEEQCTVSWVNTITLKHMRVNMTTSKNKEKILKKATGNCHII